MKPATDLNELAKELIKFQKVDKDELGLKEHVRMYEDLTDKIEEAGISYYDLSLYVLTKSEK
jgi:hypothetical protein